MSIEMIIAIGKDTIVTLLLMGAPMLVSGAVLGILISMLQTVTQLKDQSLAFVPKIIGVLLVLVVFTPFLIKTLSDYCSRIFLLVEKLGYGF